MDIFVIKCTLISHKHLAATSRLHEQITWDFSMYYYKQSAYFWEHYFC